MDEHVGAVYAALDLALELVAHVVGALERGARPELDVQVDVPAASRPTRAELVITDHLRRAVRLDRLADQGELVLRERLVDEHARGAADDPDPRPHDHL